MRNDDNKEVQGELWGAALWAIVAILAILVLGPIMMHLPR